MTATARGSLHAPGPQAVTFVELFFDLVFVFAVTEVTALTAHHLTADGVLHSVLLFWLIWWAWTQFTWTLNPADTTHPRVRAVTLVATGAAFIMATSVSRAFAADALWFAVPYVVVRLLGLGLQVRIESERAATDDGGVRAWAALSGVGLALVLAGALADPSVRTWLWLLAIVADLVAAAIAGRAQQWDLNPAHLSERHGLFVIIAIGESLIVAGTAVAAEPRSRPLITAAALALVVACLMWWTYFGSLHGALEHGIAGTTPERIGPLARDAFSLSHFPLVCGIVGFAVAIEEIVAHPDEPAPAVVVASLGLGVVLFVGFSAVSYWFLYRRVLVARIAALTLMVAALAVVPRAPAWPLGVVALALLTLVVVEARTSRVHAPVSP
jgi:low temperature requirement protein LtrA